jgi:glycosyltransferase involved in cell wall biosynthesis
MEKSFGMNKIVVDGRFFKKKPAGVTRYIVNILKNLNKDIKIEIISNNKIFIPAELKDRKEVEVIEYRIFSFLPGTIFNMFIVPFVCKLNKNEFYWGGCHSIPLGMKNTILTVHDLVAFKYGNTMTLTNRLLNIFSLKLSLYSTKYIHSVSQITKDDLLGKFKKLKKKITIVPNSVDLNLFNKNGLKVKFNYLLYVGTFEPRKNIETLIKSYIELRELNIYEGKLVLIGLRGWKNKSLIKLIDSSLFRNDIITPGYITDEKLAEYYRGTDLFVFPSLYEGYGIPPLEAYCCGVKVVTSVHTEIASMKLNNVFNFDPDSDNLTNIIKEALNFERIDSIDRIISWEEVSNSFLKTLDIHE